MNISEHRLENEHLFCHLIVDGMPQLAELGARSTHQSLLASQVPLCCIEIDGSTCEVTAIEIISDTTIALHWSNAASDVIVYVSLDGATLRWRLDGIGSVESMRVYFPFLATLCIDQEVPYFFEEAVGAQPLCDGQGEAIWLNADWPLPLVQARPDGRTLTLLIYPSTQATLVEQHQLWSAPGLTLSGTRTLFEAEVILHQGGWAAAFDLFRARVRQLFDLSHYQRPDLAWYGDQLVQHFTFLYGREILDLETGQFELDRFLDEGEHLFGGYDGMLIWGVYPRIGVDERTQWDFYDDLPGGRAGLREMARRARERGVRFFLPYKPWDQAADLHGQPNALNHQYLAQLVADVDADGVFLDTMNDIGEEFRTALDQTRPGVALCPEGRVKGKPFEMITGSWDQSPMQDVKQGRGYQGIWSSAPEMMPRVELWRFIFPEHRLFVVNRHATGKDRMRLIQRGFFNGMGWVVWQDIFGLVLNYTTEEAALLKRCRKILRDHRSALWSASPTPLLPTIVPDTYANEFPGETKRLWTLYNETNYLIHDYVLQIQPEPGCHVVDVWNNREVEVDSSGQLLLTLDAHSVGAIVEFPHLLSYSPDDHQVIISQPINDSVFQVQYACEEWYESPGDRLTLHQEWSRRKPCQVRLVVDGEVLDQLVISPQMLEKE